MFYITRQSYYYDEGAYGVEIATTRDCISPGALGPKYGAAFCECEDPREAASAAIELAERWRGDVGDARLPPECFTIAASVLVYPTVADAMDAEELRAWAEARFAAMPKCERCGCLAERASGARRSPARCCWPAARAAPRRCWMQRSPACALTFFSQRCDQKAAVNVLSLAVGECNACVGAG